MLSVFARNYKITPSHWYTDPTNSDFPNENHWKAGNKCEEGISILEALSATGLRSIRYAKEVSGVKEIIANDFSRKAVEDIKQNIIDNEVQHIVKENFEDAVYVILWCIFFIEIKVFYFSMLMYQHRKENRFDAIDLDPYGCPGAFLDSAVQSVKDGGLLLVTATDMAVLAGNAPETCYYKYGAISLRIKCCHEMVIRLMKKKMNPYKFAILLPGFENIVAKYRSECKQIWKIHSAAFVFISRLLYKSICEDFYRSKCLQAYNQVCSKIYLLQEKFI